jgi:hypothetical protein
MFVDWRFYRRLFLLATMSLVGVMLVSTKLAAVTASALFK